MNRCQMEEWNDGKMEEWNDGKMEEKKNGIEGVKGIME